MFTITAKGCTAALMLTLIGSAPALAAAPIEYLQYDLTGSDAVRKCCARWAIDELLTDHRLSPALPVRSV
jgi:hypothetical protein